MSLGRADVAVVTVTYNSSSTIEATLRSLPLADLAGVCVVDNDSHDGTADLVRQLALPGVTVVPSANVGFGAGCNAGVRAVGGKPAAYLFLNPDAELLPADLDRLLEHLDRHPACAVVAPRLLRGQEALSSSGDLATARTELRYVLPRRLAARLPDRVHPPDRAVTGPVGVVEGACMLVRRQAFDEVGGFDPRLFLFYEEHDLARGVARTGGQVHLCAEASAQHLVGASRGDQAFGARGEYFTSAVRYLRTWEGSIRAAVFTVVALVWWTVGPLVGDLPREQARAQRRGLLRGWRRA